MRGFTSLLETRDPLPYPTVRRGYEKSAVKYIIPLRVLLLNIWNFTLYRTSKWWSCLLFISPWITALSEGRQCPTRMLQNSTKFNQLSNYGCACPNQVPSIHVKWNHPVSCLNSKRNIFPITSSSKWTVFVRKRLALRTIADHPNFAVRFILNESPYSINSK